MNKIKNKSVLIVCFIALITVVAVLINVFSMQKTGSNSPSSTNKSGLKTNGVYAIPSSPTTYQIELYKELTEKLNSLEKDTSVENKVALCESIVKSFVADFYTWTNKASNYDVGGLPYVVSHSYLTFQQLARDSFYADLDAFIETYGSKELIEVTDIQVSSAYGSKYVFNFEEYEDIYVEAKWTYAERDTLDVKQFQHTSAFHVIFFEGQWQIAQMWALGE